MVKIKYSQEIDTDKAKVKSIPKSDIIPFYRVYTPAIRGNVRGYWIDKDKLYKDKLVFKYCNSFDIAVFLAKAILKNSKEVCISIENIKYNRLYFIYRDKIEVFKIKYSTKTLSLFKARQYIRQYIRANGGATLYKDKGYFKIFSYR